MYHVQSDLVWNSQIQDRLKNQKVLKLKTNMVDTRWLNFLYSILWKILKFNKKIKKSSIWVSSVKPCAFPIQGKCHFQFWASWSLESPGQPLRTPDHMAAPLSPGWSYPTPRKHYAHEEGWVALGNHFLQFWAFLTVFDSNRQNAAGPLLGAKCHRLLMPAGFLDQEMPS